MSHVKGYIKDHRQELNSDIWLMPPLYHRVWQWLKYQVNHTDNEIPMSDGSKFLVRKGQHLTSTRAIAQGVGWFEGMVWKEPNPKTIKQILDWLTKNNMIKIERGRGNRQYTLITLISWDFYQGESVEGNSKYTATGQPSLQQMDINNNDKNEKNDKKDKDSVPSSVVKEIINYLNEKANKKFSYKSEANKKLISGRLREGRTIDDFKHVINVKCDEWLNDEKMSEYLRPATLFSQKNFENYVNQNPKQQKQNDFRDIEIAFQRWVQEGNNPDEFNWSGS